MLSGVCQEEPDDVAGVDIDDDDDEAPASTLEKSGSSAGGKGT
jgi:hypothetical protein